MNKVNKILKITGVITSVLAVMALLSFVGSMRSAASCEELVVYIHSESAHNLVTEAEIRNQIHENIGVIIGEPLNKIHTKAIEAELRTIPHVRKVRVYETINKKLFVELEERKPMVRLIDHKGRTGILDENGYLMPLSDNAVLRLPVITGAFSLGDEGVGSNMHVDDSLAHGALPVIYSYAFAIAQNPFWKAQIQQTDLSADGDFIA